MAKSDIKKVVLANSGGLDTSVIVKWLQEKYGCEVATFEEDAGAYDQGDATGFVPSQCLAHAGSRQKAKLTARDWT